MRLSLIAFAALATLALAPAQNRVWIVDKKGGPGIWKDTLSLMSHVRDGDLVLLRAGDYSALPVVDQSVTIVHDTRTGPVSIRGLTVFRLSATKNVTVRGVRIGPMTIQDCKGGVALDRCETSAWVPNKVVNNRAVTFTGCTIKNGVEVTQSTAHLHGCQVASGFASTAVTVGAGSILIASESQIQGTNGAPGMVLSNQCYVRARPGGHGLGLQRSARAELTNCVVTGGKAAAANPPCAGAPGGDPVWNLGGTLVRTARAPRSLKTNSPVREGERLTIEIGGQPGDEAFLLYNLTHGAVAVPGCGAALFPSLNHIGLLYAGRVGSGPVQLSVVVQPMAAATNFTPLAVQALVRPKSGCALTPPTTITLLDKRF